METDHNLPEWLLNPLKESLIKLFVGSDPKAEKLSIINEYQGVPVKDKTRLYRGARKSKITHKLKELLLRDQKSMANLTEASNGRFVPFLTSDPRIYHLDSNLPTPVRELLTYYYWRVRIPPDSPCQIQVGLFGRQGKMVIKPPTGKIICRVVIHLGPNEVYKLTEIDESGKYGFSTDRVISDGSYMVFDQEYLSNHNIFVSPNPHVKFPLPENCDEMIKEGLSAVGSGRQFGGKAKLPKSDSIKKMMSKSTIRLRSYRRLTVVLDFGSSSLIEDDKMIEIANFGEGAGPAPPSKNGEESGSMEWPDELPSTIPPDIAKSLPPGIDPSIIGKVFKDKKLSGMISGIAKSVAADLEGREELQSSEPMITKDLVGAIAASAVNRINPNEISRLSDNIEAVASDVSPALISKMSRKTKRRRARRARRTRNKTTGDDNFPDLSDISLTSETPNDLPKEKGKEKQTEQQISDTDELLSRIKAPLNPSV
uniref:Uncharacterized protein n=1 Tax=Pithovirus LCPAC202 TaxID=2506592 RepID=A0A481Z6X4_9VIRU|nr:MAG: hypothetical protein LCPAC202_01360 [Pithovirus LCPAC202]